MSRNAISKKERNEVLKALKILYPTPLGECLTDKNSEEYKQALEFINSKYLRLNNSIKHLFPTIIFELNGEFEFKFSESGLVDLIYIKNNYQYKHTYSRNGRDTFEINDLKELKEDSKEMEK